MGRQDSTPLEAPPPDLRPFLTRLIDRLLHKRAPCEKHCHCVTEIRVKVAALWWLFLSIAVIFARHEIMTHLSRQVHDAEPPRRSGEVTAIDRVPPPDAGRP